MIEPMTTAARETTSRTRWALPFLAALVAVLATVFGAASVSAATGAGAETRVRASQSVAQDIARPPEAIRAGQRLGNEPAEVVTAVATGVAANAAPKVGWGVGDDIYSLTKAGNTPAWSTVRARFWKNEATNPRYGSWTDDQLARMRTGRAPQRYNQDKGGMESMDLSHEPIPYRDGGTAIIPRWPQDHAAVDRYRYPGY